MMRFWLLLGALAMPAAVHAASPAPLPAGWEKYVNVRYGFAICYPARLLVAQGEASNSDGQAFRSRDGAELRAFGANNVFERSLDSEAESEARAAIGPGGKITYRVTRPGWTVVSGTGAHGKVFYSKTFLRDDQFVTFQLVYPAAMRHRYKPVVERLSRCFRLTEGHA